MAQQDLGAFQGFPAEGLHQALSEMREQTEDGGRPEDSQGSQPARTRIHPLSKSQLRKLRGKRPPREKTSAAQEPSEEATLPSDWTRTRLEGAEELPLNRRKRKIALRRTLIRDRAASLASTEESGELSREGLEKEIQERSMRARIQPHAFGKQVERHGMETALADFGKNEGARLQRAVETANEDRWKSLGSRATDEDKMDSITKALEDSI